MRMRYAIALSALLALQPCYAGQSAEPVDLVGRNGQFTVKNKSGNVETVAPNDLKLQKELMPSAPRTKGEGITEAKDAKPGDPKAVSAKPKAPKPAVVVEETEEQKAIRAADVEALRAMRNQGGAYFYTEDNQPVPFNEIDRRIATGEVEGLKAVGLHLEDWRPQTKSKSTSTASSPQAPAEEPSKQTKKY